MGYDAIQWYCRPVENGFWSTVENAFGIYTPCAMDSVVICVSYLVVTILTLYRIWLIKKNTTVKRYSLRSPYYNYVLGVLAGFCAGESLYRAISGISILNMDGQFALAPFEIVTLTVNTIAWLCLLIMLLLETKIYIYEFRWYARFGITYALMGECALFSIIFTVREYYSRTLIYLCAGEILSKLLFGFLLLFYMPDLDTHPGYIPLESETPSNNTDYELLPGEEQVFPERHSNLLSKIYFSWMTPLMEKGFKKPLTEKDIWKLDSWDLTETLYQKFNNHWIEESKKPKPWLLRSLNSSLGGRFWLGGLFKIGNDALQFVGPVVLNLLLQSMQQGDPSWNGYIYAFSIFLGVALGVLSEAQYFQNVMRVGFRLRSTLVAAVFRKSLRLTPEARKRIASGKITNLITADTEQLQQVCQQLHSLWSAPFRIIVAIYLLYKQLGVSSFVGAFMLMLLFPIQQNDTVGRRLEIRRDLEAAAPETPD